MSRFDNSLTLLLNHFSLGNFNKSEFYHRNVINYMTFPVSVTVTDKYSDY